MCWGNSLILFTHLFMLVLPDFCSRRANRSSFSCQFCCSRFWACGNSGQVIGTGTYYDSKLTYRMSYDPLVSQTRRLIEYVDGRPAPVGLGFDRWFVFLHKLEVPWYTELLIAAFPVLLLALSLVRLKRMLREQGQSLPESPAVRVQAPS